MTTATYAIEPLVDSSTDVTPELPLPPTPVGKLTDVANPTLCFQVPFTAER